MEQRSPEEFGPGPGIVVGVAGEVAKVLLVGAQAPPISIPLNEFEGDGLAATEGWNGKLPVHRVWIEGGDRVVGQFLGWAHRYRVVAQPEQVVFQGSGPELEPIQLSSVMPSLLADLPLEEQRRVLQPIENFKHAFLGLEVEARDGQQETGEWFIPDQSLETWVQARLSDLHQRAERSDAAELKDRRGKLKARLDNDGFVNPYTFVPLPDGAGSCRREAPPGHHALLPGRFAGELKVVWEAVSPLLVVGATHEEVGKFARSPGGAPVVPGSSLKGAIRSLHETIAGGCLRVLDESFVPVYRQRATPGQLRGRTLGRIEGVDTDGRPTLVDVCSDVAWFDSALFDEGSRRKLKSGDCFRIVEGTPTENSARSRVELRQGVVSACLDGPWTILVTDDAARPKGHPYFVAAGKLTGKTLPIEDSAWDEFLRLLPHGAPEKRETLHVKGVGTAHGPGQAFEPGHVIWIREANEVITEVSLAALWRVAGKHSVEKRVGEMAPCRSSASLCPSCRLFGHADPEGSEAPGAPQASYRSHVRITDAEVTNGFEPVEYRLAPRSSPRPGAGQFYLENQTNAPASKPDDPPTRQWGARTDSDASPRRIRGRKHYWHAWHDKANRHLARKKGHSDAMTQEVELLMPGAQLRATVRFENLSLAEIGGLLAAIDPGSLLTDPPKGFQEPEPLATHIGGGKPLGLGSVRAQVSVEDVRLESSGSRYLGEQRPSLDWAQALKEFTSAVPDAVKDRWPDVAAVLDPAHVRADRVSYPPGASWADVDTEGFLESYRFFARTDGAKLHKSERPLATLRDPRELDQDQEIPQ